MEEELEQEFYNDTTYYDDDYNPNSLYIQYLIHHILTILLSFIGLLADAAIIYTISSTKILYTKTYVILANFCINEIIFLIVFPISSSFEITFGHCFHRGVIMILVHCIALMFILLINPLMKQDKITTKRILQLLYIPNVSIAVTRTLLCYMDFDLRHFEFSVIILYALLVITILFFEGITICKRNTSVLDEDYVFRFNLCRIYTYNVLTLFLVLLASYYTSYVMHNIVDYLILSYLLNGFYMLLYCFYKDKKFNMAAMSILRRDNYKIDEGLNQQNFTITDENPEV